MKFVLALAVAALPLVLGGCMGPEGNPNAMAYADEPGGAIGAPPQSMGTVSYNPYGPVARFDDMKAGAPMIGPTPYGVPSPPAPVR